MSFTELMGSAKGPGLIGMIIALVVLAGFALLFTLVFQEDSMSGTKSLASIVKADAETIQHYEIRLAEAEEQLSTKGPHRKQVSTDLMQVSAKAKLLNTQIENRNTEMATLESEVDGLIEDFENYKNQYRAHVRNKASGTQIEKLVTVDGKTYHGVEIRKVTAVGIEVRHRDGHKRIAFEELPEEMQEHYQFDKDQKNAELLREAKIRRKHNQAVAAANEAAEENTEEQRAKNEELAKQRRVEEIAQKQARLQGIEQEIRQLESDISSAESAASSARAAGRRHLNKAGSLRGALNSKRAEHTRLSAEISRLRS
jgi:chromosome segregation ATPase